VVRKRETWQRLPDGRYRAQPRHPVTGARLSITAQTLGELQARLERLRTTRSDLRYGLVSIATATKQLRAAPVAAARRTAADLWPSYLAGLSPSARRVSRSTWARRVQPYVGGVPLPELTESALRTWLSTLEAEHRAPKSREAAYYVLAGIVRQALGDGTLESYPWGAFRPARAASLSPREALASPAELARLLAAAREREPAGDLVARVATLALAGVRVAEAAGLGWDDVDLAGGMLVVRYQAARDWRERWTDRPRDPTKGRRVRRQIMHPALVTLLAAARARLAELGQYRDDGPVFPSRAGAWRTSGTVLSTRALRVLVTAAGLPNVHRWVPHSLRHSFASLEVRGSGGDLRAAQSRTGHATLAQLEGYVHASGRGLSPSSIGELPELAPGPPPAPRELAPFVPPAPPPSAPSPSLPSPAANYTTLAAAWLAAPGPSERPIEVTAAARRAYRRARARALTAGLPSDEAKAAGRRAHRASLGAWARALGRASRA